MPIGLVVWSDSSGISTESIGTVVFDQRPTGLTVRNRICKRFFEQAIEHARILVRIHKHANLGCDLQEYLRNHLERLPKRTPFEHKNERHPIPVVFFFEECVELLSIEQVRSLVGKTRDSIFFCFGCVLSL